MQQTVLNTKAALYLSSQGYAAFLFSASHQIAIGTPSRVTRDPGTQDLLCPMATLFCTGDHREFSKIHIHAAIKLTAKELTELMEHTTSQNPIPMRLRMQRKFNKT